MRRRLSICLISMILILMLGGCMQQPTPAPTPVPQSISMQPTEAELTGPYDSYLFVPIGGETYRYERYDTVPGTATRGEHILSCVEDTGFEQFQWEVYAVEEYPDCSFVWAEAEPDFTSLYQYSPPKRSEPGALEQARSDGIVIMEDGDVKSGQQAWLDFVKKTQSGEKASVLVGHYYTLNEETSHPDYYEAHKEDYPILYLIDLRYDGELFSVSWEENGGTITREYRYLMHYTGDAPTATATYKSHERYVLTNDNTVTWEDLMHGMASSQFGDYIDHYSAYTDLTHKDEA